MSSPGRAYFAASVRAAAATRDRRRSSMAKSRSAAIVRALTSIKATLFPRRAIRSPSPIRVRTRRARIRQTLIDRTRLGEGKGVAVKIGIGGRQTLKQRKKDRTKEKQ